ncbi:hypothetical protein CcCBS67573_g01562 [Chytriomyces confervae]|uniref:NEDD8-activating enzyme E1 regulatory subunit n=1 Tax=Chytriomyces confervae TaxID=246404 RepID=A0A507FNW5_9FUNG|nr:NEDD8-activating enzyme E1 regulatory subunit [Chytriomyces hyalinus]TPX77158.1 hypothetical protein CcCBS67573_g01562 [Chytriomyces confervae]
MASQEGPSKEQKYDRQLRLWQAHGQRALENANILVVNACATATETLKNLVLPGIGSFTILDDKVADGADVGNNFFLDHTAIGQSRGKYATELLRELNPDVDGFHVDESPSRVIASEPSFFDKFTLVIATQLSEADVKALAAICWERGIPFLHVRSYGFVGYLRLAVKEHAIVETHPESILDLRLDCPFKELTEYADSFNLSTLENTDFAHVPYVVILLQALQAWRASNGKLPSTTPERNAFKAMVKSMERPGVEDENFQEAMKSVFRACSATVIPGNVASILNEAKAMTITPETSSFWILACATAEFAESEKSLPLAGVVPDMKSDTESFVKLQTIYRDRSHQDAARVHAIAASLAAASGATAPSMDETARFCKNARLLKVIRTSSIESELSEPCPKASEIGQMAQDLDSCIPFYLLLRGVDAFYAEHMRYPGYHLEEVETDIGLLKKSCAGVLTRMGLAVSTLTDDLIHETVRAGASELHTMASFMGGVCSQEVIKLITSQYVPLNNTFLYNGIKSVGGSFDL